LTGAVLAVVLCVVWLGWPVYQFFAHTGRVPMLPFGWVVIEGEAPVVEELLDSRFRDAADNALRQLVTHRENTAAPAISAAILIDGQIVWRAAVGWADIETRDPVTLDSRFRIGSTSKAITATALARLVARGVVDLDTPVSEYLDVLPNAAWASITPRQLASHMAGLPHYKENGDRVGLYATIALSRHYDDVRDALEIFDESPLLFEPGTDFHYSSLGTVLLGAVMSAASGKSYRQLIRDEVFEPAGMTATFVAPRTAPPGSGLATFYYRQEGRYREWRPVDLSHRLPGGGWASTPSDLVRMGSLHLDESYLPAAVRDEFWTPQKLASGDVNEQDYALGWRWREYEVEGIGLLRNANHGGVSRGAQSWLMVLPDFNAALAVNINAKTPEFTDFASIYAELLPQFLVFSGH
jgi:CubicO group peptidase (beta-lactamase class C family)